MKVELDLDDGILSDISLADTISYSLLSVITFGILMPEM